MRSGILQGWNQHKQLRVMHEQACGKQSVPGVGESDPQLKHMPLVSREIFARERVHRLTRWFIGQGLQQRVLQDGELMRELRHDGRDVFEFEYHHSLPSVHEQANW